MSEAAISMAEKLEVRITRTFNIANGKPAANGVDSSNPSRKVFINDFWTAKKDIKRGGVLQVLATPPQPGKRDWFVIDIPIQRLSGVSFAAWQSNEQLPETTVGGRITSISIGCAGCGACLLAPEAIFKFKGGCIWSRGELLLPQVPPCRTLS